MSSRKNPWKRIGRPDYEGIHLMPFDTKNRAVQHELNRQRVITQILLDLYCMGAIGIVPKGMRVALKGAGSQSLSGSKVDKTEAAHCVPSQIVVGVRKPQDILFDHFPERAFALDSLFAETDILPANFNKSDSRAERNGLKEGFRIACQSVLTSATLSGKLDFLVAVSAINKAYFAYKKKANDAFIASIARLEEKIQELQNSRIQFTIRTDERDKWQEQHSITKYYQEALQGDEGTSSVLRFHRVNGIFIIYNMV